MVGTAYKQWIKQASTPTKVVLDNPMPFVSIKEEPRSERRPIAEGENGNERDDELLPDLIISRCTDATVQDGPEIIDLVDDNDEDDTKKDFLFVTPDEVAQAFSHFSYVIGGRRILICDLQGVYDRSRKLLQFTDPVIHYNDNPNWTPLQHPAAGKKSNHFNKYGRTDRGSKGIEDFLQTHVCNGLCELVTKGFFPAPQWMSNNGSHNNDDEINNNAGSAKDLKPMAR